MAGYVRQSVADIINGADVTAPPLTAEFNQLASAFDAATGHAHDGSTGGAPPINLATSVSGYLQAVNGGVGGKNNNTATTTPVVTNDNTQGYAPGSIWENSTTGRIYICVGNATSAAVWRELVQVTTGNAIIPAATNQVDLGTPTVRFQDLYLSGGASISGTMSVGTNLIVTGATTLTGTATFNGSMVANNVDIGGGNIDATIIGAATPAAATVSSLVATTADINGGTIDGTQIGASAASTVTGTTITGANLVGPLAGAVTGDVTGDLDGDVTGNVTGNLTGNVTAGSGTSSFTNVTINGSLDLNAGTSATVTGLSAPVAGTDATTKTYVDNADALKLNLTGGTLSGALAMGSNKITGLGTPTATADAATKGYVDQEVSALVDSSPDALNTLNELAAAIGDDANFSTTITTSIGTKLPKAGGTMTGAIAMGTSKITGLGTPTAAADASTKAYTDAADALKVAKAGDTMSGALAMGSNKVTGLGAPTAGTDATTKTYVDAGDALKVSKSGDTMSGVLAMGANKITGVADPTLAQDVVTKNYSDTLFGSTTAAATSAANAATSEGNSLTYSNNSANSATAAATSESNAAASLESFTGQYLSQATAPSSPDTGDLWFDETTTIMKVYDGTTFVNAGSTVNGIENSVEYIATAGQTTFVATYDIGFLQVYQNGFRLDASDYTATNGTSVVLDTGAVVSDTIFIQAFGTFELADHYNKVDADARFTNEAYVDAEIASLVDSSPATLDTLNELAAALGDDPNFATTVTNSIALKAPIASPSFTGTVTADGLTVDGNASVAGTTGVVVDTGTITTGKDSAGSRTHWRMNNPNGEVAKWDSNGTDLLHFITDEYKVYTAGNKAFEIDGNGDISFYDSAGSSQKFFWDASAENLKLTGIGGFTLDNAQRNGALAITNPSDDLITFTTGTNDDISFVLSGAERLRLSSNGNVGIGSSSPDHALHVAFSDSTTTNLNSGAGVLINNTNSGTGTLAPLLFSTDSGTRVRSAIAHVDTGGYGKGDLAFYTMSDGDNSGSTIDTSDEAMRISSAGHVSVGTVNDSPWTTTTGTSADNGIALRADGILGVSAYKSTTNAGNVVIFNRTSTDGGILAFNKGGSNVGSIGVRSAFSYYEFGSLGTGIGGTNTHNWLPYVNKLRSDATISIGNDDYRLKDLYLSGGVYLGGTGAANKLDDYEEGYYTAAMTSDGGTITLNTSYDRLGYTKVGRLVTVTGLLIVSYRSGVTGHVYIDLPFTALNQTDRAFDSAGSINAVSSGSCAAGSFALRINEGNATATIYDGSTTTTTGAASSISGSVQFYLSITYTAA